jgi:hypothetical protein
MVIVGVIIFCFSDNIIMKLIKKKCVFLCKITHTQYYVYIVVSSPDRTRQSNTAKIQVYCSPQTDTSELQLSSYTYIRYYICVCFHPYALQKWTKKVELTVGATRI